MNEALFNANSSSAGEYGVLSAAGTDRQNMDAGVFPPPLDSRAIAVRNPESMNILEVAELAPERVAVRQTPENENRHGNPPKSRFFPLP